MRGLGWAATMVAAALSLSFGSAHAVERIAPGVDLPVCGPRGATTLASDGIGRVYSREDKGTFACIQGSRPKLLSRPRSKDRRIPSLYQGAIAVQVPWVAFLENFIEVDVGDLEVGLLNLRTGRLEHCYLSRWSAAAWGWFEMTGLVVGGSGKAAWMGRREERGGWVREVAACDGGEVEQLDSGSGIDLKSLRLRDSVLTWMHDDATRSTLLR